MADFLQTLVERVEDYRKTNKNPCKNYATREAAEKATAKIAQKVANCFSAECMRNPEFNAEPARYIIQFVPSWGRWVGFIDMTEVLRRPNSLGGYIGVASDAGFFSY